MTAQMYKAGRVWYVEMFREDGTYLTTIPTTTKTEAERICENPAFWYNLEMKK